MNFYLFYHSLVSDWNHGNAHFLRGIISSLQSEGHNVQVYEPVTGWSFNNMLKYHGINTIKDFNKKFPFHKTNFYSPDEFNPGEILHDADVVIVHEWNDPEIVQKIGEHKLIKGNYQLYFHDTHHRSVTDSKSMQQYDLRYYDGVLAFGNVIRDIYKQKYGIKNVWTWHEAADTNIFTPPGKKNKKEGDLVWIGNWGDNERTSELLEYIIEPVKKLGLKAKFYGVRYPKHALRALEEANIEYGGWIPNFKVPEIFSKYRVTVHVPRRPYVESLPGIPTIRPFEALSCGIPLICSPWNDNEKLFRQGEDYLMAHDGSEMINHLKTILEKEQSADLQIKKGLEIICKKHTCNHRKDELLNIINGTKEVQNEKVITYLTGKKYLA
ncbi:MAG: CgeB family protein [Bacteroidota bacterium]